MSVRRPKSIKFLLLIIVTIIALPAVCITIYSGIQFKDDAFDDARLETQRLADRIATEQENLVLGAEQLMILLDQLPDVRKHDRSKVEPILRKLHEMNPIYSNIFIANQAGNVWATAVPTKPQFNVADREYFKNAVTRGRLSSGEYVISRATLRPVMNLGHPLVDDRGKVTGVISVGLALDQYQKMLKHIRLPERTSFVLCDHRGIALFRAIVPENFVGKPYNPDLFGQMQREPDGSTRLRSGIAGDSRITTIRKLTLPGEPSPYMYITVGIPLDVALHKANESLIKNITSLLLFLSCALVLAWVVGKRLIIDRISLLQKASYQLASGELKIKISDMLVGGELGQLAQSFDSMAGKLELREQALIDSQEHLRYFMSNAPVILFALDLQGGVVFSGGRGLASPDQNFKEAFFELLHKSSTDFSGVQRALAGEAFSTVVIMESKAFEIWYNPVKNVQGEVTGTIGVATDITERQEAVEKLQASEEKFSAAFRTSPDSININRLSDGKYFEVNDGFLSIMGYQREEVIGKTSGELSIWVNEEDRERLVCELKKSGEVKNMEAPFRGKDGKKVTGLMSARILSFSNEPYILSITRDITERKKSEELLQESEKTLRNIINVMPVGVAIMGNDGSMEFINRNFEETYGYSHTEIPTIRDWVAKAYPDPDYRQTLVTRLDTTLADARENGMPLGPVEVNITCKDGTVRHTILNRQLSGNRKIAIHTDITDRDSLQKELLNAQKLESLGILAGGIAHDFNNILTGILGNISFMRLALPEDFQSFPALVQAEKASLRAAELATQLLTFAKGGAPTKRVVSLPPLIEESMAFALRGSNVKGVLQVPTSLRPVEADEGQLAQALNNIVLNAVQAMPEGGTITVSAREVILPRENREGLPSGCYVILSLADEGTGMSEVTLQKIFDPYFSTKPRGTGLGLASAHSILTKHGGRIEASSTLGKGSVITLLLPAVAKIVVEAPAPQAESVIAQAPSGGRVLVLDDEPLILALTTQMLEHLGYIVTTCSTGEEAIRLFYDKRETGTPFDAAIMDLTIPGGMGGKEAARQILITDQSARLIVSSGYSNDPILSNYNEYGFCSAIAKPYKVGDLANVLSSALGQQS